MAARTIDGRAEARALDERTAAGAAEFRAKAGRAPGLAAVLVGDDPASALYVASKERRCAAAGMVSLSRRLPADTPEADLLALVAELNADPAVDGILVQLPLPRGVDAERVLSAVAPGKDVDGFHDVNAGRLAKGRGGLPPCTPAGCMILARRCFDSLAGVEAVVIGRSNIVGRPMAQMLINARATVSVVHSATRDAAAHARRAELLVAAAGSPGLVRGDWVREGAVVIDVGINRLADGRIVGDVDAGEAAGRASALTPVPGGVGPMTIACLLDNTLAAARAREGI